MALDEQSVSFWRLNVEEILDRWWTSKDKCVPARLEVLGAWLTLVFMGIIKTHCTMYAFLKLPKCTCVSGEPVLLSRSWSCSSSLPCHLVQLPIFLFFLLCPSVLALTRGFSVLFEPVSSCVWTQGRHHLWKRLITAHLCAQGLKEQFTPPTKKRKFSHYLFTTSKSGEVSAMQRSPKELKLTGTYVSQKIRWLPPKAEDDICRATSFCVKTMQAVRTC